ncbi:MAG: response regulator [Bacteroidota bacterium]
MGAAKILFADDDSALREVVGVQLVGQGYVVEEADDGEKTVEMLRGGNYDVLLLDINMPGKTGIDVLKFVKEEGLNCRVIMLTGRVGFSIATETIKLGAVEYITKPFTLEYLLSSIERVLAKE